MGNKRERSQPLQAGATTVVYHPLRRGVGEVAKATVFQISPTLALSAVSPAVSAVVDIVGMAWLGHDVKKERDRLASLNREVDTRSDGYPQTGLAVLDVFLRSRLMNRTEDAVVRRQDRMFNARLTAQEQELRADVIHRNVYPIVVGLGRLALLTLPSVMHSGLTWAAIGTGLVASPPLLVLTGLVFVGALALGQAKVKTGEQAVNRLSQQLEALHTAAAITDYPDMTAGQTARRYVGRLFRRHK